MEEPLFYLAALAIVGVVFRMWLQDYRANVSHLRKLDSIEEAAPTTPSGRDLTAGQLPGAMPVGLVTIVIAAVGALMILGGEVAGEYALGVVEEQTEMTVIFGVYTLAAAFVEELIFRGYLYYDRGSKFLLVLSIVGISVLFALLHAYLWKYDVPDDSIWWAVWRNDLSWQVNPKSVFSTTVLFLNSLWFYTVRFFRLNPLRSLIPCIAAHLASNAGVFLIKAIQGKVTSLW